MDFPVELQKNYHTYILLASQKPLWPSLVSVSNSLVCLPFQRNSLFSKYHSPCINLSLLPFLLKDHCYKPKMCILLFLQLVYFSRQAGVSKMVPQCWLLYCLIVRLSLNGQQLQALCQTRRHMPNLCSPPYISTRHHKNPVFRAHLIERRSIVIHICFHPKENPIK